MASTPYYNAGGKSSLIVQGEVVENRPSIQASTYNHASSFQGEAARARKESLIQASVYDSSSPSGSNDYQDEIANRNKCRDVIWGVLFYLQFFVIIGTVVQFAPTVFQDMAESYGGGAQNGNNRFLMSSFRLLGQAQDSIELDEITLGIILGVAGLAGLIISTISMTFMMHCARHIIKTSLIFNIVMTGAVFIMSLSSGLPGLIVMSAIGMLISAYYARLVWNRVPFAAANLKTAVVAVRSNIGLAFYAFFHLILSFLWSVLWAISIISTLYVLGGCDVEGNCEEGIDYYLIFFFLVSYFWTAQVLKNVVTVTVAGTVGTWWFVPSEASSCCSQAVRDSYRRSMTTSFGSICLGSLIVAIIQAVKEILHSMREGEDSILLCCADCLLVCLESIAEYFNQWAFVYVGIYGHSFMDAGKNVMTLFDNRGWTAIITDTLINTVLMMTSICIGLLTGAVGVIVGNYLLLDGVYQSTAFGAGLVIGYVMCNTLFSLIGSAVNAVIVCYAEAPAEFDSNHRELSNQMREAWKQAYPKEFQY